MPAFPVKSASELMDAEFDARWSERESIGPNARSVLGEILDRFVADGGPISVASLGHESRADAVHAAVTELDAKDLIALRDGHVVLAYPFAAAPTGFVTQLASGVERHACCAIDALGVAAMLREPIVVRARCHHCGAPLELPVTPDGAAGPAGVMAWIGRWDTVRSGASARRSGASARRARACEGL